VGPSNAVESRRLSLVRAEVVKALVGVLARPEPAKSRNRFLAQCGGADRCVAGPAVEVHLA